jgi:selenocysteine-specific translation elongation factor
MKLKTLIKNTAISEFQFLADIDQLKQQMSRLEPKSLEGKCIIPIDHAFNVKGVGTVILGVIKQGAIKTFDKLKILPSGKDILVKSIQMHDDPVTECKSPARVGLAVKGVDADNISRGDVLCSPGSLKLKVATDADAIPAGFVKSSYYKGNFLTENQTYVISLGIQIKPVKIKYNNTDTIEIIPEKIISVLLWPVLCSFKARQCWNKNNCKGHHSIKRKYSIWYKMFGSCTSQNNGLPPA